MLRKNYSTLLNDPVSWKVSVNRILRDIDDRLKSIEDGFDVSEGVGGGSGGGSVDGSGGATPTSNGEDGDGGSTPTSTSGDGGSDGGQYGSVIPEYLDPLVEALWSTWYNPTDAVIGERFVHGFNGEVNVDISSIWEDATANVSGISLYDMQDGEKYDFPFFVISSSGVQQVYGVSPPTSKSSLSEALRTDFIKFASRVSTVDGENNVNIVLQVNHSDSTHEEYLLF